MANLVGQRIGQYQITAFLGAGGMASVYRARQASMRRDVAIKIIKTDFTENSDLVKRFEREVQTIASLGHAHILKVFDYGTHENIVYLVMELLTGGSLDQALHTKLFDLRETNRVLEQIASALDYAHRHGVIHRDIKPPNFLMDEDRNVYLSDFGIVKLLDATSVTVTGAILGTPAYMAPEVWRGERVDGRADIYALGVSVYQMLSGELPFKADTTVAMMWKHVHEPATPIREINPKVPILIQNVLDKVLAKDPDERFQSAGEFAATFNAAMLKSKAENAAAVSLDATTAAVTKDVITPTSLTGANVRSPTPLPATKKATAGSNTAHKSKRSVPIGFFAVGLGLVGILCVALVAAISCQNGTICRSSIIANRPTPSATMTITSAGSANTQLSSWTPTPTLTISISATPTITLSITPSAIATATHTFTPTPTMSASPTTSLTPTVSLGFKPDAIPSALPPASRFDGLSGSPSSIAVSPNGSLVAGGSFNNPTVKVWNGQTGQVVYNLTGHTQGVTSAAFSPDGKYLVTGSPDHTAILWDMQTGQLVRRFNHANGLQSVAYSPDGQSIATGDNRATASIWQVQSGNLLCSAAAHSNGITGVAFSPDGQSMLTGGSDMSAKLWNAKTCQLIQTFNGHTAGLTSVAFSPSGQFVLTASSDNTARLWPIQTGQTGQSMCSISQPRMVFSAAFSPNGHSIITTSDNQLKVWDAQTCQPVSGKGVSDSANGLIKAVFWPDGNYILTGGFNGPVVSHAW